MSDTHPTRLPRAYTAAVDHAPKAVLAGQHSAALHDDEIVVFLIGMRIHRWRKIRSWLPAFVGMPRMLRQLARNPEAGLLWARSFWSGRSLLSVQYWRSAEHLGAYARDPDMAHAPAWAEFNRRAAATGDVGVYHETYTVPADGVESLYANMPRFGLSAAQQAVSRSERTRTAAVDRVRGGEADPTD